jgi:hypothetical protein
MLHVPSNKHFVRLFFIPNPRSVKRGGPQTRSCCRVFVVSWMDGSGDEDKMDRETTGYYSRLLSLLDSKMKW